MAARLKPLIGLPIILFGPCSRFYRKGTNTQISSSDYAFAKFTPFYFINKFNSY